MAKVTKFLEFTIHLTDKAVVAAYQAGYPSGVFMAPEAAAIEFDAPIQFLANPNWENQTPFSAPCIRSPYMINESDHYPRDVAEFTRKSGGWFGISGLFGTTYLYKWVGKFAYSSSTTPEIGGTPTEIVAMAQRKFICGWMGHQDASGRSMGADARNISHDGSRHPDMAGFSERNENISVQINMDDYGMALSPKTWERLYFRIRTAPTSTRRFWRCISSSGINNGATLNFTSDRRMQANNMSVGVETIQGTTSVQFELDRWYRLDILLEVGTGILKMYVARELVLQCAMPAGAGLASGVNHTASLIGSGSGMAAADVGEFDICDWTGATWPTEDSGGRYTGIDWLNGTKIQWVPVNAFATGNNWAGDYRYLNQNQAEVLTSATAACTSSVSGDALRAVADLNRRALAVPGALGASSFLVVMRSRQQVAGNGTIGWKIGAGAIDLAAINPVQSTNFQWDRRLYNPSGNTAPIDLSGGLELHHVKALNANAAAVVCMGAFVELIGTFGDEDVPTADETSEPTAVEPSRGKHMSPWYPESIWARASLPPVSPIVVHSGTYVGNGTVQTLTFRSPVTWLMIRNTSGTGHGGFFWSSMMGMHASGSNDLNPSVRVEMDPTYLPPGTEDSQEHRTRVTISGDNTAFNAAGITYQYITVQDPGARLHLNGAYSGDTDVATHLVTLPDPAFTPGLMLFQKETINDGTFERYLKGPGHAADAGSILNGAESATVATFGTAQFTSRATLNSNLPRSVTYNAWRVNDGSGDPNIHKVVTFGTYTGDGTASRTVSLAPATGLRPLYAIVTPHNAASLHRDPAATGTTSWSMGTGLVNASTGITAGGIDQFSVGSALNANGIVYDYFVLYGSATAGNGGWSIDGEFIYVEPDWIGDGYDDPDDVLDFEDEVEDPDPDPGPSDTEDCDAGAVCVEATTRLVNLALLKIGVQHFLTNYCTDTVKEAQVARKVFEVAARYTLRMFPWPFATKYAALSLAATQPSNEDWTYSYRMPVDCIYARRIVTARNKAVDPKGPPFMQSSDASGGLIFSNQADAVLEYTFRPTCVSYVADALFTEAFAWKLGAEMAPGLSRMTEVVTHCLENFKLAIEKAESDIKPGVPGKVPAADAGDPDTTAAQIAANVAVINRALLRIGARTIANYTTDQSREAIAGRLIFEDELQATLRDFPWAFATKYAEPTLVGGTATLAVNLDWQYSFRTPTDCVMVRRLVTARGRSYEPNPDLFRTAEDATGGLIFCHTDEPTIEYTAREAGTVAKADAKFRDAFAWRLAAALAPSLAQVDPEFPDQHGRGPEMPQQAGQRNARKDRKAEQRFQIARYAWARYQEALSSATTTDANEKQEDKAGDADWILDRGAGNDWFGDR